MVIAGLADSLDANARSLATCRRIQPADGFPLARLIDQAISDLELHRQDSDHRWRRRRGLGSCVAIQPVSVQRRQVIGDTSSQHRDLAWLTVGLHAWPPCRLMKAEPDRPS